MQAAIVVFALGIVSCSKTNTATPTNATNGLNGATGATGITGATGVTGVTGASGQGALIAKSDTVTITNWNSNSKYYYVDITDTAITNAIVATGAVEIWISFDKGVTWNQTPYVDLINNYNLGFNYKLGEVIAYWTYSGNGLAASPNQWFNVSSIKFKIIAIPGSAMPKYKSANSHDYETLKRVLNFN